MHRSRRRALAATRARDEILDAAARAFARGGYEATTVRDIAAEAGYAPGALYAYFDGKAAIFAAVVERIRGQLFAPFEEPTPADLSFAQKLELVLLRQFEVAERHRDHFVLFSMARAGDFPSAGPAPVGEPPRGFEVLCERVERWLEAEAGGGDLGACPPWAAACALVGLWNAFFRAWLGGRCPEGLRAEAPRIRALFLGGVRGVGAAEVGR